MNTDISETKEIKIGDLYKISSEYSNIVGYAIVMVTRYVEDTISRDTCYILEVINGLAQGREYARTTPYIHARLKDGSYRLIGRV